MYIYSWLSQNPHEAELLFSPLTGCEIIDLGKSNTDEYVYACTHMHKGIHICVYIHMHIIIYMYNKSWLSQYPHEAELFFSPLPGCEIIDLGAPHMKAYIYVNIYIYIYI